MSKRKPLSNHRTIRYVKPTVIVLGDGETEQAYIKRLTEIDYFPYINLKFEIGSEENFETKRKEHINNPNVLVILDIDNVLTGTKRYNEISRLITTKEYKDQVYYNNFSFETWLLNHKTFFSCPITLQKQYNTEMSTCFAVSHWYTSKNDKNRRKIVDSISDTDIGNAVKNVARLSHYSPFDNPSSNMDQWVDTINKKLTFFKSL
jgi:hypothetical protein